MQLKDSIQMFSEDFGEYWEDFRNVWDQSFLDYNLTMD